MKTFATILAVLALLASGASALPLAYEGFDYTTPGAVSGQNGGHGWADAWDGTDQHDIASPGLTYTDGGANVLPVEGNYAAGVADEESFRSLDVSLWPAAVKTGTELGAADAVIWVSFIGQAASAGQAEYSGLSLHDADGDEGMFFGNPYNSDAPAQWGLDLKNDNGVVTTDVNVDQQRFVLVRMTWDADNNTVDAHMWLNPPLDGEAGLASVPAAEQTSGTADAFTFTQVRMYGGNVDHDWDEIRFGTTYDQVVPEPVSMALLTPVIVGLFARRRRQGH